jgi:teichuronic acid biosynthesis glycosyltransferase TuaC
MRVLIVCSGNKGEASPFVLEQAQQLEHAGCIVKLFLIQGKGWRGYLRNRAPLLGSIAEFKPDVVHAHSGMSALLAGLQRRVPAVATYHGSDVNVPKLRFFTRLSMRLCKVHIVVSADMKRILRNDDVLVLPCAVNTDVFIPADRMVARQRLGWSADGIYVLFSSSFSNAVKNAPLAMAAVEVCRDYHIQLMELKDKSREDVALMLNACDAALMTSFTEGSPQFVKEAMACGVPVVSTRVGDVAELSEDLPGHFMVGFDTEEVARGVKAAILFRADIGYTNGPDVIRRRGLTPNSVAMELMRVYTRVAKV